MSRFVLSLCVLTFMLATVAVADDLHDLSSLDEPQGLDAAAPLVASAKRSDLGEEVAEREKFGFGGMMTSGSFMMMSSGFEEEELGEGEDAEEKFGFGGMMTSGSFMMMSSGFEE